MKKLKLMFGAAAVVGSLVTGTCDAMLSEKEGRAERSALSSRVEDEKSDYEKAVEDLEKVKDEHPSLNQLYIALQARDWGTVDQVMKNPINNDRGDTSFMCFLVSSDILKDVKNFMDYAYCLSLSDSSIVDFSFHINSTDARGHSPLELAMEKEDLQAAHDLAKWGASVDVLDGSGNNVLHHAVKQGNVRFIRLFADKTGDINAQNKYDKMALHLAAEGGNLEVARVLIDHGADPFIKNDYEISPLDVVQGRTDFSSQRIRRLMENRDGYLHIRRDLTEAAKWGEKEKIDRLVKNPLVKYLIRDGSFLCTAVENNRKGAVRSLLLGGFDPNVVNDEGVAPLHLAMREHNLEIMMTLWRYKADPMLKDSDGKPPYNYGDEIMVSCLSNVRFSTPPLPLSLTTEKEVIDAVKKYPGMFVKEDGVAPLVFKLAKEADSSVVQPLIDLRLGDEVFDSLGRSPALVANAKNRQLFIKAGSGMSAVDTDGHSIWWYLLDDIEQLTPDEFRESIRMLDEQGVSVLNVDSDRKTLIHRAIEGWRKQTDKEKKEAITDFIRMMVERGADVDVADRKDRATAIRYALRYHYFDAVQVLLDAGADVSGVDIRGRTLIHQAISSWRADSADYLTAFIRTLVERGVDINAVHPWGDTAISMAVKNRKEDAVWALLKLGANPSRICETAELDPQLMAEIRRRQRNRS